MHMLIHCFSWIFFHYVHIIVETSTGGLALLVNGATLMSAVSECVGLKWLAHEVHVGCVVWS